MRKIKFDIFDLKSIEHAIDSTNVLASDIEDALDKAIDDLATKASIRAQFEYSKMNLAGSDVASKFKVKRSTYGFVIYNTSDHSDFVEFGTGIVGANSPHPESSENGWVYDSNGHGEKGWIFPLSSSDIAKYTGVVRYTKSGMAYVRTRGMISRPVMYNVYKYLNRYGIATIEKYLRKIR
jgi:hypothetical protein